MIVFDKYWFKKHQRKLLYFINHWLFSGITRYLLRIKCNDNIVNIAPNSFTIQNNNEYETDFRTHNKYSKRLYYALKPIWHLLHCWDVLTKPIPQLNLGFDTLTAYPETGGGGGNTTCDGIVYGTDYGEGAGVDWSTLVGAAGAAASNSSETMQLDNILSDTVTNKFRIMRRGVATFDTSSLTGSANISSAVLSIYGKSKADGNSCNPSNVVVEVTLANNNDVQASDFTGLGSVSFSNEIDNTTWSTIAYNAFTLNATGRAYINKTGVSPFGIRNKNYDIDNSQPNWVSGGYSYTQGHAADTTGIGTDPKLVLIYTLGAAVTNNITGII